MPVPRVKTASEPIEEVQKVTTITNPVGQKNVAGTQVNPATEDTLTSVKTAVEALTPQATTPVIYNVTMTNADTEYSQALPANTKRFTIQARDGTSFRLAFETGKVAIPTEPYLSIGANSAYYEDGIKAMPTLYFGCASAGKVAEIVAWS